jgi:hypothetical protein
MEDQVMADENQNQAAGGSAAGDQGGGSAAADSLDAVMGAYVATAKQLPGVVPELISGKNLNEINASIDTAKAAYARVAGQVAPAAAAGGAATPPLRLLGLARSIRRRGKVKKSNSRAKAVITRFWLASRAKTSNRVRLPLANGVK